MDLGSTSISRTKISNRKDSVALADFCAETVTAPFRAPELFDPFTGSEINESTDAWALGCTIYAMTYGESPFDGSMTAALSGKVTFPDQAHSHINWLITDILKVNADLRPGITEILAKLEGMSSTRQFSPENA